MPDQTRPNWLTEEMQAHRDFGPILESFAAAWGLRREQHDEATKRINAEIDQRTAAVLKDPMLQWPQRLPAAEVKATTAAHRQPELDKHEWPAATLKRRIDEAKKGVLVITKAERAQPEADRMLLPDWLIEMAERTNRLKEID